MSSLYGRGQSTTQSTTKKKPKTGLIVGIIVGVVILIIIIIAIILLTRKSSSTGGTTTGTSTGSKCTADSQCLAPNKKCNTATGVCVGCLSSGDCTAPNSICNTGSKLCVQCLGNADCTSPATCVSNKCCDNSPPTNVMATINLDNPSKITGTYTPVQSAVGASGITRILDSTGFLLYQQGPNSNVGNISVTETETPGGGPIFPTVTYQITQAVKNSCGQTSAFTTPVNIVAPSCPSSPTPTLTDFTAFVNTNAPTLSTPGINFYLKPNWPPGQFCTPAGFTCAPNGSKVRAGIIVYTDPTKTPNLAPMIVRNVLSFNSDNVNEKNGYSVPWQGITPAIGTTYYGKVFLEITPSDGQNQTCISALSNQLSSTPAS